MIHLSVSDEVAKYSLNIARKYNLGNRGKADGTFKQQRIGIAGQKVVSDYLGVDVNFEGGFDGGVDLTYDGKTYDVKTMGRDTLPQKHFVNNLVAMQVNYNVDRYIFCSLHKTKRILTICGWIDKDDFIKKASYYKEGVVRSRDNNTKFTTKFPHYEIKNSDLNEFFLPEGVRY